MTGNLARTARPARLAALAGLVVVVACSVDARRSPEVAAEDSWAMIARVAPAAGMARGAAKRPARVLAGGAGFELGGSRGRALDVAIAEAADLPMVLRAPRRSGAIEVLRASAERARGALAHGAVVYGDAWRGVDAAVFRRGAGVEELLVVRDRSARPAYDVAVPEGWSIVQASRGVVVVRDERGKGVARMRAEHAWDARGRPVEVRATLDGARVTIDWSRDAVGPILVDPAWELSSSTLDDARGSHTATLLTTGAVLIAGGDDGTNALGSAVLYDPVADAAVTLSASLVAPRTEHTATALRDRRVLLAGGRTGTAPVGQLETYDPARQAFTAGASLATARYAHTATLLADGTVLLVGGVDGNGTPLASAELFDPKTNAVKTVGPMQVARSYHTASLLPTGKVLVAGGASDPRVELYDPGSGTFADGPTMNAPRMNHTASVVPSSGSVYLIGGTETSDANGNLLCSVELYDYAQGTFTDFEGINPDQFNYGYPIRNHTATSLDDGTILLTGGESATPNNYVSGSTDCSNQSAWYPEGQSIVVQQGTQPLPTVYDLAMQDPRSHHTATLLPDGSVLVIGGYQTYEGSTPVALDTIERRTTENDVDVYTGTMSASRFGHTASLLRDGRVLVAGGASEGSASAGVVSGVTGVTASTEVYRPVDGLFAPGPSLFAPRYGHTATVLGDASVLLVGGAQGSASDAELVDVGASTVTRLGAAGIGGCTGHTSTLLADGRVLVAGGCGSTGTDAYLYDPASRTIAATGSLKAPRAQHVAVRLMDGSVLVVGGAWTASLVVAAATTAEIFDPATATFHTLKGRPRHARVNAAATLLGDGTVLLAGGDDPTNQNQPSKSTEVFSLAAGASPPLDDGQFAVAGDMIAARAGQTMTTLPSGRVLIVGGDATVLTSSDPQDALSQPEIYDPATSTFAVTSASSSGAQSNVPLAGTGIQHAATLLQNGDVLVTGGFDMPVAVAAAERLTIGSRASIRGGPALAPIAADAVGGQAIVLVGSGFTGVADVGGGTTSGGAGGVPLAYWMPINGGPPLLAGTDGIPDGIATWDAARAAWIPPTTALAGPGLLFVAVNDMRAGTFVRVSVAGQGSPCARAADCGTGFCVDGVCCESACGAKCMACSAAAKGHGADGTCEPKGATVIDLACKAEPASTCSTTGLCDGKGGCASYPDGTSCGGSGATCAAGSCVTPTPPPPPAAPPHCDGNNEVLGTQTIPCGAFRCLAATGECAPSPCTSNLSCADGLVCSAGQCVAFTSISAPSAGCSAASSGRPGSGAWLAALAAAGLALVRSRRRSGARSSSCS